MMQNCFIDKEHRAIVDLCPGIEMGFSPKSMIMTRINVPREHRRKGVGTLLLQRVLTAADINRIAIYLEINPSGEMSYEQLEAWYLKHGFKRTQITGVYKRRPKST